MSTLHIAQRHFFPLRPSLSRSLARYQRFNLLFLRNFRPLVRSSNNASHFSLCPTLSSVGSVEGSQKEIVWLLVKDETRGHALSSLQARRAIESGKPNRRYFRIPSISTCCTCFSFLSIVSSVLFSIQYQLTFSILVRSFVLLSNRAIF